MSLKVLEKYESMNWLHEFQEIEIFFDLWEIEDINKIVFEHLAINNLKIDYSKH